MNESRVLCIDRSQPFNPEKFIGDGWKVKEAESRSLALLAIKPEDIYLKSYLASGEDCITGKESLSRKRNMNHLCLDAGVLRAFWKDKYLIPESWKEKVNGAASSIFFDGSILYYSVGFHFVLCLRWDDGWWRWRYRWIGDVRDAASFSAVIIN